MRLKLKNPFIALSAVCIGVISQGSCQVEKQMIAQNSVIPILDDASGKYKSIFSYHFEGTPGCLQGNNLDKTYIYPLIDDAIKNDYRLCFVSHALFDGTIARRTDVRRCNNWIVEIEKNPEQGVSNGLKEIVSRYEEALQPIVSISDEMVDEWLRYYWPFYGTFSAYQSDSKGEGDSRTIEGLDRVEFYHDLDITRTVWTPTFDESQAYSVVVGWKGNIGDNSEDLFISKSTIDSKRSVNVVRVDRALSENQKIEIFKIQNSYNLELQNIYEERFSELIASRAQRKPDVLFTDAGPTVKTRLLNRDLFCDNHLSDAKCMERVEAWIGQFAQDRFHVRKASDSKIWLNTADEETGEPNSTLNNWSKLVCAGVDSSNKDRLAGIAGGNMFVVDNLVFIGADVLHFYQSIEKWRTDVGARDTSKTEIERAILRSVFDRADYGHVLWVGTPYSKSQTFDSNKSGYQPEYHLDLFFHPVGIDQKTNTFWYIRANLESDEISVLCNTTGSSEDKRRCLQDFLDKTWISLEKQVKKVDSSISFKALKLPQRIGFFPSGNIQWYKSAVNGISEVLKKNDGSFAARYLMPTYISRKTGKDVYPKLFEKSKKTLENAGITVSQIRGHYGSDYGLRCKLKILERKN